MRAVGSASPSGFHPDDATIGSVARLTTSNVVCSSACTRIGRRDSACAYA